MTPHPVFTDRSSIVQPEVLSPPVDLVRGYYRAYEAQQRHTSADRARSELFVLREAATLEGAA